MPLRGRKARALLARLALARGRPLRRDTLASLLWDGKNEAEARSSLRQALTELRRALGPEADRLLQADDTAVALASDHLDVDVLELERLCTCSADEALDRLAALAPQRLLEDLGELPGPFVDWIERERLLLHELTLAALERWLDASRGPSEPTAQGTSIARTLLTVEPAHEPAHRYLMRAHARRGDTAAALRQLEVCKRELERRLDAKPSHVTLELGESIRQGGVVMPMSPPRAVVVGTRRLIHSLGPSVIVLPFLDPEGSAGEAVEGLQEELASSFALFRSIRLMPPAMGRQSVVAPLDLEDIAHRLGAQYVVTGAIHRRLGHAQVTISLVECASGRTLLSESSSLTDRPDPVTGRFLPCPIVSRAVIEIVANEIRRAVANPTDDVALNLTLRALPAFSGLSPKRLDEAGVLLDRALALDPSCVLALCFQSFNRIIRLRPCSPVERADLLGNAIELAGLAAELDPRDTFALSCHAHARVLNGEHDEAFDLQRRAIAANPLNPGVLARHSVVLSLMGDQEDALAAFDRYVELSPHDSFRRYFGGVRSMICMLAGRLEESASIGKETMAEQPQLGSAYRSTIAALGHLGRIDEARPLIRRLLELEPGFDVDLYVSIFPLRREEDRNMLATGMRLAGLH